MDNNYIHETAIASDNKLANNVKIYKETLIKRCVLESNTIIGDFTRLEDSHLSENVTLQRNNLLYSVNIGRYSYTGKNCTMWHCTIGAFCSISWNVSIGGANHDYKKVTTHSFLYSNNFHLICDNDPAYDRFLDDCVIGNDVWIGCNAVICRGVHIGDGAVVGAGAVVTHDIKPYEIVVGAPAKPIKKRFSEELILRIQKTQWWKLPDDTIRNNFILFASDLDENVVGKIEKLVSDYNRNSL